MTTTKIRITAEDLTSLNPVEKAIRRATGRDDAVVGSVHCMFGTTPALLPDKVQTFIVRHDNGRAIEPITFDLDIPATA